MANGNRGKRPNTLNENIDDEIFNFQFEKSNYFGWPEYALL